MAPLPKSRMAAAGGTLSEWLRRHQDEVQQADNMLASQLSSPKPFGEHSNAELCDEILSIVKKSVCHEGPGSESSSVLLMGEAASGKTHAVEYVLQKVKEASPSVLVLRAHGHYGSDLECVRHLAAQVSGQTSSAPRANASFEAGMAWLREVLVDSFKHASAVVVVLDKFESFCSRSRQTLLYNLFDIAQEFGVCLSIIGTSEVQDVGNRLEKRIRSRFSMRNLHSHWPSTMEDLIAVLTNKLRLPVSAAFKVNFIKEFHQHVKDALWARASLWEPLCGQRSPMWFLWKCLPLGVFFESTPTLEVGGAVAEPPAKKARLGTALSTTHTHDQRLLLESLAEVDLIVLLGLFRLEDRRVAPTLSRVLFEVQTLHENGSLVHGFVADRYSTAFERLVELRLVRVSSAPPGCGDAPRRYLPCKSDLAFLGSLVQDLERETPQLAWSPLRKLPQTVQRWAARQRK